MFKTLTLLILVVLMSDDGSCSKVASKFVRISLDAQLGLARKVREELKEKTVYLFDQVGFFNNASQVTIADVRVVTKDDIYAVLSVAAQGAFATSNTYCQFTLEKSAVVIDSVGVKLAPIQPTVTLVD